MDLGLADKVCVVTGSTVGIGFETARQLREEGATIVTSGRSGEGIGDLHVAADLARPGEPERLIAAALERFGRVDCLVNNVGWHEIRRFDELTDADWEASWQLNVMSAVRALRAALPGMRERGSGAIVNVSSTSAKRPSATMPEYSVTKAAMLSLSRARRRPLRQGRDPLQRGHAGPDRDRGVARRRWTRRPAGRARRGAREGRRGPPARPARRSRTRSPP